MNRGAFLLGTGAFAAYPLAAPASSYTRVAEIAHQVPGVVGVYCRTLAQGPPAFAFNEHVVFPTASTIKTLIMTTAFVEEERRPGTLDEHITTNRSELIGGSDFMSQQPDGARFTVRELIVPMITLSDNTASNYLISFFGMPAINAVGARLGMSRTRLARHFLDFAAIVHHNDNVTTPADTDVIVLTASLPIYQPRFEQRGVPVANKTGELDGSRSDIAIVEPFGDSPYILIVYSKWLQEYPPVYQAFHRLARLSYGVAGRSDA